MSYIILEADAVVHDNVSYYKRHYRVQQASLLVLKTTTGYPVVVLPLIISLIILDPYYLGLIPQSLGHFFMLL